MINTMENTILVVDDSPTATYMICNMLTLAGYRTITADSAAGIVDFAKSKKPKAILMDIVMSGENGFQATRRLKNDPHTQHIPIIMLTAKSKLSDKVWGLRQGAAAYLTKPISNHALLQALKSSIAR